MNYAFSNRISSLQPSAIREILKFTSDPAVIPFAAGNPSPEAFPAQAIQEITSKILSEKPIEALQYGVTEGYAPLRGKIRELMKERYQTGRDFDNLILTAGAQQVMDLTTKAFCNEGDAIICECPSFIGSLNCFRSYLGNLVGIDVESDGMNIEMLEKALQENKNVKFIYTIPNFQNPSGVTMSLEKRRAVYELAKKYGVLILEDNPYGDLRVDGESLPNIKSFDEDGIVIYAGTFSKILSPGLRVGYAIAPETIIAKLTVGKQSADVHTPVLNQMIVYEWLNNYDLDEHLHFLQDLYRKKLNLMCDLIESELPSSITYNRPQGGLFVWCKLPDGVDMSAFCKAAVLNKVAVVPGNAFMMHDDDPTQCFRMNFSTPTDEGIIKGMKLLAETAKSFIK